MDPNDSQSSSSIIKNYSEKLVQKSIVGPYHNASIDVTNISKTNNPIKGGRAIFIFSIFMFGIWLVSHLIIKFISLYNDKYNLKKNRHILNITILVVYLVILIPMIISENIAINIEKLIELLLLSVPYLVIAAIIIVAILFGIINFIKLYT